MTDDELFTLFEDSDDPSNGMASYRSLYQAGYRAAMKEAKKKYEVIRAEDWTYKNSWEIIGEWLDDHFHTDQHREERETNP